MVKKGPLTAGQRFHFLTGWFSWFADALHMVFTLMALGWTAGMLLAPTIFSLPMRLFLVPVMGFFVAKALFGIVLYRERVPCGWRDTLDGVDRQHGAFARDRARHLDGTDQAENGHSSSPPRAAGYRAARPAPSPPCARNC